jgi:hypothetical protein
VYQGPINSLLFELNAYHKWRLLWGNEQQDERMRDLEYILRFFALSDERIISSKDAPAQISLKKYLNQYMESKNKDQFTPKLKERFIACIDYAYEHFGVGAFHNISPSEESKLVAKFSPTVFDSVLIAIDLAQRRGDTSQLKDGLEGRRLEKLKDPAFQKLLSQETMRVPNIRKRVSEMFNALFGEQVQ